MNRLSSPPLLRLTILLLLAVAVLAACERPLQEDTPDLQLLTPEPVLPGLGTPDVVGPGLQTPQTLPGLATPTGAPGEQATPGQTTPAEPGDEQPTVAPTATPTPEPTVRTEEIVYVVVRGDTLGEIAKRFGVTVEAIAQANDIANVNRLEVGQQLLIPPPGANVQPDGTPPSADAGDVYIVQRGDTLFSIGRRYGFTVQEMATYNNLADPNDLDVGQRLLIPPQGYSVNP